MKESHKCWSLKGRRPTVNHYCFRCVEKIGFLRYVEFWNCWKCWKEVKHEIPMKEIFRKGFQNYYKCQKCHKHYEKENL